MRREQRKGIGIKALIDISLLQRKGLYKSLRHVSNKGREHVDARVNYLQHIRKQPSKAK